MINKNLNKVLLEKRLSGKYKLKLDVNYYDAFEGGRYVYELGNLAIQYPLLKSMMLDKLNQESKNSRVIFKNMEIKNNGDKKMKFIVDVKIKK